MGLKVIYSFLFLLFLIVTLTFQADITVKLNLPNYQKGTSCYNGFLANYDTINLDGYIIYKDVEYWGAKIHLITIYTSDSKIVKEKPIEDLNLKDCLNKTSPKIQCERTANSNVFEVNIKLNYTSSQYETRLNLTVVIEGVVIGSDITQLPKIFDPSTTKMTFDGNMLPDQNCTINPTTATIYEMCCDENAPMPTSAIAYIDGVKMTKNERCITFYDKLSSYSSKVTLTCSICSNTAIINKTCSIKEENPKLPGKKDEHCSTKLTNVYLIVVIVLLVILLVVVILGFAKDMIVSSMQKHFCKKKEAGKDVKEDSRDMTGKTTNDGSSEGDDLISVKIEKGDKSESVESRVVLKDSSSTIVPDTDYPKPAIRRSKKGKGDSSIPLHRSKRP